MKLRSIRSLPGIEIPIALACLFLSLGLSACASKPKPTHGEAKGTPVVKPQLVMIPVDQVELYKQPEVEPETPPPGGPRSTDTVTTPVQVEAYPVARLVDPTDPNVMHERHVVYRRTKSRWKLNPPPGGQIIVGPTVADSKGAPQPVMSQEADALLREQRAINESTRRAIEALYGAVKGLQEETLRRQQMEQEAAKKADEAKAKAEADAKAKAAAEQKPEKEK